MLTDKPWDEWVDRVVIMTSHYLKPDGSPDLGGRIRYLRDLAQIITRDWGKPLLIVQKGLRDFETTSPEGYPVVGLKVNTSARGDPQFGWRARKHVRSGDGVLYGAGAQAGWPFYVGGAKALQHGIGWDGPYRRSHRLWHTRCNVDFLGAMRSVLCVDTNYINWARGRGARGLEYAEKCVYVPNYADLDALGAVAADRDPGSPLRLMYARRFDPKRGPIQFMDALALLHQRGFDFSASMFSVGGDAEITDGLKKRGISDRVRLRNADMDEILAHYHDHDVAVVPTIWSEGTSLAAVEAICAGMPVVATPVGGLGNLIIPGFNGELVAPTAQGLARGISRYGDTATWRAQRANCLSLRESLSFERWQQRLLDWVQS